MTVSKSQLKRYPIYLSYLKKLKQQGIEHISSSSFSDVFGYSQDQVRKDFQAVSNTKGKPKTGRSVDELIESIESFLGYDDTKNAVIIGIGDLGSALLKYDGFSKQGINILAGFDVDKRVIGQIIGGKKVYPFNEIDRYLAKTDVKMAILTTPASRTQKAVDVLIANDVKAFLNFAPVHLELPDDVVINNIDIASSLALLSIKYDEKKKNTEG